MFKTYLTLNGLFNIMLSLNNLFNDNIIKEKKTMKKVLSLILAVIIIASAIPVAFATDECEHIFYKDSNPVSWVYDEEGNLIETYCQCDKCGERILIKYADYDDLYLTSMIKYMAAISSVYSPVVNLADEKIESIFARYDEIEDEMANFPYILTEKYQATIDKWAEKN